jgi:hypothetical protein
LDQQGKATVRELSARYHQDDSPLGSNSQCTKEVGGEQHGEREKGRFEKKERKSEEEIS